jgi:hypothetical protein
MMKDTTLSLNPDEEPFNPPASLMAVQQTFQGGLTPPVWSPKKYDKLLVIHIFLALDLLAHGAGYKSCTGI